MKMDDVKCIKLHDWINYVTPKTSNVDPFKDIPENIPVDYELLTLIGWYVAEGSCSCQQFNFSLNANETTELNQIKECIKILFNRNTTFKYSSENCISAVISSVVLSKLFPNLCGRLAQNKKFPDFIMHLPIEKQAIALRSVWMGDGGERYFYDKRTKNTSVRCYYKSVSYELSRQVQILCHRLGYIAGLSKPKRDSNPNHQQVYIVTIEGDDALAFKQFIETGIVTSVVRRNKKSLSLQKDFIEIEGVKYIKRSILSIEEKSYSGKVYNLEVTGTHTYIADNIVVHNCGAGGGGHLLFYCPDKFTVAQKMKDIGGTPVDFTFDYEGVVSWVIP
jgi:hypothetical protein